MLNKKWFQTMIGLLLLFLIVKYFLEIKHLLNPFIIIAQTIFIPVLLAAVLFYITVPIQRFLEKRKFKRWQSISTILVMLIVVTGIMGTLIISPITTQVSNLIQKAPTIAVELEKAFDYAIDNQDNLPEQVTDVLDNAANYIQKITVKVSGFIVDAITSTIAFTFTLFLVPFFYIFMLKDHEKFAPSIYNIFNGRKKEWLVRVLKEMNQALSSYVQGQVLISFLLSLMIFLGYSFIGLEYALLLALFAFFMNMIPFIGPWVALAPAVIVAFLDEPIMALWVCIITLIAQQIESNIITPNIMGKSLDIHPLTVITLVMAAGSIAGFIGIIIAIPTYAIIKVVVINIFEERTYLKKHFNKEVKK